jgi:hypothetical protein
MSRFTYQTPIFNLILMDTIIIIATKKEIWLMHQGDVFINSING